MKYELYDIYFCKCVIVVWFLLFVKIICKFMCFKWDLKLFFYYGNIFYFYMDIYFLRLYVDREWI